jgi:hypothetical protein
LELRRGKIGRKKRGGEGRGWGCRGRKGKAKGEGRDGKTKKDRGEKGGGTWKRKLDLRSSRQIDATELDNALSQLTFETNHSVVLCPYRILFCHIYGTKSNSITQLLTTYGSDIFDLISIVKFLS